MNPDTMKNYKIILCGWEEGETGDVITRDGEYLGTWELVDDVFHAFIPDGETEHLFFEPFLGMLCWKVWEWHEERERSFADTITGSEC
ncbi:hypothetical protein J2045_002144 [Peteryoungia aggregata LMG 23059]|uniref:Uncharacterized protein n=1 Tax=Peteryoungia aggregata LMG 23059 TaxID=1368425 RepID=A0ABU0G8X7_9HYPH|nr:hypothetical protein [Peteryoungia aggregata]MDQ0421117.1 hypothetical protein [Peteryoungia aggregata LMG 23059]